VVKLLMFQAILGIGNNIKTKRLGFKKPKSFFVT
jgi:hypothetical protein